MRNTIDHVRPGAVPAELYTAAKTTYEKEGFEYISQMVGHSIGVAIHEAPVLEPDEPTPLQPGMVVQIEHGVDDHVGGRFHIEETVLVTDDAPKILSDYAPTNRDICHRVDIAPDLESPACIPRGLANVAS